MLGLSPDGLPDAGNGKSYKHILRHDWCGLHRHRFWHAGSYCSLVWVLVIHGNAKADQTNLFHCMPLAGSLSIVGLWRTRWCPSMMRQSIGLRLRWRTWTSWLQLSALPEGITPGSDHITLRTMLRSLSGRELHSKVASQICCVMHRSLCYGLGSIPFAMLD